MLNIRKFIFGISLLVITANNLDAVPSFMNIFAKYKNKVTVQALMSFLENLNLQYQSEAPEIDKSKDDEEISDLVSNLHPAMLSITFFENGNY